MPAADGIALVGATLIDSTEWSSAARCRCGDSPRPISRSGPVPPLSCRRASLVDLTGRWIAPAPIDSHTHQPSRHLGPTPLSRLGRDHRSRPARSLGGGGVPPPFQRRAQPGAQGIRGRCRVDGLPTTYPDAIGVSSDDEARKAVDGLVKLRGRLHQLYPSMPRCSSDHRRGPHLQCRGHRTSRHDRCRSRGQGGGFLDRAPDWGARGGVRAALLAHCSSLSRFLCWVDHTQAMLGA